LIQASRRYYTVTINEFFDLEKLTVYQDAIRFVVWTGELLETLLKSLGAYRLDAGGLDTQHVR